MSEDNVRRGSLVRYKYAIKNHKYGLVVSDVKYLPHGGIYQKSYVVVLWPNGIQKISKVQYLEFIQ